jgi:hypothetical protein
MVRLLNIVVSLTCTVIPLFSILSIFQDKQTEKISIGNKFPVSANIEIICELLTRTLNIACLILFLFS